MQIFWLRSFLAVAEHMSFSAAANHLYISQSSLSKHIKSLEEIFNVKLLDRTTHRLRLTPAGERFYRYASQMIKLYDSMFLSMQEYRADFDRTVRIVIVPATYASNCAALLSRFKKEYPDVDFQLIELEMPQAMTFFNDSKADFAIVRVNLLEKPEDYFVIPFHSEEMFVLCSRSHPFASKTEVPLKDVVHEKLVLHKNAVSEITILIKKYLPQLEVITPTVASTNNPTLFEYVANGMGISLATMSYTKSVDPDNQLARVPVTEKPYMQLGMLVRRGALSATCVELMNYVTNNLEFLRKDKENP